MATDKWVEVLRHLLTAYIETGKPVGSKFLVDEFELEMSSATVRNIMKQLTEEGYLSQPHTSAGRVPEPKAYRYYFTHLSQTPQRLSFAETLRQSAVQQLESPYELLHFLAQQLAEQTGLVGLARIDSKWAVHGFSHILDHAGDFPVNRLPSILRSLEDSEQLDALFGRLRTSGIRFLIGEELQSHGLYGCTVGLANCEIGPWNTQMAVVGPMRMNYEKTFGSLCYLAGLD